MNVKDPVLIPTLSEVVNPWEGIVNIKSPVAELYDAFVAVYATPEKLVLCKVVDTPLTNLWS